MKFDLHNFMRSKEIQAADAPEVDIEAGALIEADTCLTMRVVPAVDGSTTSGFVSLMCVIDGVEHYLRHKEGVIRCEPIADDTHSAPMPPTAPSRSSPRSSTALHGRPTGQYRELSEAETRVTMLRASTWKLQPWMNAKPLFTDGGQVKPIKLKQPKKPKKPKKVKKIAPAPVVMELPGQVEIIAEVDAEVEVRTVEVAEPVKETQLVPRPPPKKTAPEITHVVVQFSDGTTQNIDVDLVHSIADLKLAIELHGSFNLNGTSEGFEATQRLLFDGRGLDEDDKCLQDYGGLLLLYRVHIHVIYVILSCSKWAAIFEKSSSSKI